jgi:hypothetical protein
MRRELRTVANTGVAAITLVGITLLPNAAMAQADDVEIRATIYGYVPSLGGTTRFPTPVGSTIDISAETLIENTDFALMGAFEVQKGRWGAFSDTMYFDLGGSRSATRDLAIDGVPLPVNVTANATLDTQAWMLTLAANFRAVAASGLTLDVFGGARLLDVRGNLDFDFSSNIGPFVGPSRQGSAEARPDNWDGVAGAKGRVALGRSGRFYVPFYIDIGAGQSDLTWQGLAGIAYAFRHVDIVAIWRYLDYELKPDARVESLEFKGPAAGVTFHW